MALTYRNDFRFGSLALPVRSFTTQIGRRVHEYVPQRGDGAQLLDVGKETRIDTLDLVATGTATEIVALHDAILELSNSGETRRFFHALDGNWPAKITSLNESVDSAMTTWSITIQEDRTLPISKTEQISSSATFDDLETAADSYDLARQELEAEVPELAGLMPLGSDVKRRASEWTDATDKQTILDMEATRAELAAGQERLNTQTGTTAHNARINLLLLRGTTESHFRQLQADRQFITVRYDRPISLMEIIVATYPGKQDRALEIYQASLKSITARNPGRIQPGTEIRLPRI